MSLSAEYIKTALRQINEHRENAELGFKRYQANLFEKYPQLKAYDNQIYRLFSEATKQSLQGNSIDVEAIAAKSLSLQSERLEFLKANGISEASLVPKYSCTACDDSGYTNGKLCDCVRQLASRLMYDELNKNVPLEQSTFSNFYIDKYPDKTDEFGVSPRDTMLRICNFCVKYANEFSTKSKNLLFYGKTGIGKTHLSLAIANEVIKNGFSVVYGPINRIMMTIQNEYFSREHNESETLNGVVDCDLLILDDLGTEFCTPFITSTVYDIINARILNGKPTIISTNMEFSEIEKKYSQRIVSRISGCYRMFEFLGNDIRAN